MDFSKDELIEAKRQIDSTLHKLRETIKTFEAKENTERYKSQITLAKRRVKAFEIADWFIENEIKKKLVDSRQSPLFVISDGKHLAVRLIQN